VPRRFADLRRTVRLFRTYRGSPKVYIWGVLLLIFEAATAVIEPYPIAYLVDFLQGARPSLRDLGWPTLVTSERIETLILLTAAIILIAAINSAADSMTEVCMARGGRSLGYRIRVAMYSHLQRLSLAYHDKKRTGDVLTRVTGDVLVFEEFVVKSVSNILGSLLVLVGSFALLLHQSWSIALIALLVVPLLGAVSNYYSRRIKEASKAQRTSEGDLASTAQEMLTSIRLVQSYGRGKVDLDQFADHTQKSMHASLGAANIQATFSFVIALVEAAAISAVVWLGVWLVDREAITVGTLVLFVLLLQNMFKPARKIVSEWYKIGKVFASVERIDDLLERDVVVRDLPGAVDAPKLSGRLAFQHVSFTYPAEHEDGSAASQRPKVLDDIDFEAAPGEVVALVGPSGAGKSTIAQLVPRLYDPDDGAMLVDGVDARSYTLSSLRGQVSLVLQDTVLLSGTVAENIAYGVPDPTPERIEAAARMANAHDFIVAMPDGYETLLAERGATLSGGQRQRIAIARAFIRETPILLLDEPTTGLDVESTQLVLSALRSLMHGRTTIVISHDSELIRCADRVLVMSGGRIVESGHDTHDIVPDEPDPDAALERLQGGDGLVPAGGGSGPSGSSAATATAAAPSGSSARTGASAAPPAPSAVTVRPQAAPAGTEPTGLRSDQPGAVTLADGLGARLPGLGLALDEDAVVRQVETLLAGDAIQVLDAQVGSMWWRDDGTCTVRYRVDVARDDGSSAPRTVLGRLCQDGDAAAGYVADEVLPMAPAGRPDDPAWRTWAAVWDAAGLALHPFPVDPVVPTLPQVFDLARIGRLLEPERAPAAVEVVRHARDGSCVLRYTPETGVHGRGDRPPGVGDDAVNDDGTVYGKVYGEIQSRSGTQVLRTLRELRGALEHTDVRTPEPLVYEPAMRLLLTRALRGRPLLPSVLARDIARGSRPRTARAAVPDLVSACGRMLATLHAAEAASAPVRPVADDLDALRRQVDLVAAQWPAPAERISRSVQRLVADAAPAPALVLCHGDFTPSQLLVDGARLSGLVDLDTVSWSDPALDLGRFLAHVELLATKTAGPAAEQYRIEVAGTLLRTYCRAWSGRDVLSRGLVRRVAVFRGLSLASSALRACRQLKDDRLRIALSLLDTANDWNRKVDL
jgi:ABC-type multidrug transport system fused ATPase/permease subunit/aminoglycoside phosphotransferase (APT) family kinase protein